MCIKAGASAPQLAWIFPILSAGLNSSNRSVGHATSDSVQAHDVHFEKRADMVTPLHLVSGASRNCKFTATRPSVRDCLVHTSLQRASLRSSSPAALLLQPCVRLILHVRWFDLRDDHTVSAVVRVMQAALCLNIACYMSVSDSRNLLGVIWYK